MRKIILLFLFFLIGCSAVTTNYPIGDRINKDLERLLNGKWECNEQIFHIKQIEIGLIKL